MTYDTFVTCLQATVRAGQRSRTPVGRNNAARAQATLTMLDVLAPLTDADLPAVDAIPTPEPPAEASISLRLAHGERLERIMAHLTASGPASCAEISAALEATPANIQKGLYWLQKSGRAAVVERRPLGTKRTIAVWGVL